VAGKGASLSDVERAQRAQDDLLTAAGPEAQTPAALPWATAGGDALLPEAVSRLAEAVVRGLDLDVEPDRQALKIVVRELVRAFAGRHPGRTVEVRVPPYAAVQCLEGPRHTRGTPPNVVEADPLAWVRVCAGRATWSDLLRGGGIRASGDRSDLSVLFPLTR
jgi:hypothetical protein